MKFLLLLKPVFVHYVLMCSCSCVLVHLSNLVSNLPLVLYPVTYIAVRHCTFIFVVLQESKFSNVYEATKRVCEQFIFHRFGSVVYSLRQIDSNTPFCKSMSEADNVNIMFPTCIMSM